MRLKIKYVIFASVSVTDGGTISILQCMFGIRVEGEGRGEGHICVLM